MVISRDLRKIRVSSKSPCCTAVTGFTGILDAAVSFAKAAHRKYVLKTHNVLAGNYVSRCIVGKSIGINTDRFFHDSQARKRIVEYYSFLNILNER